MRNCHQSRILEKVRDEDGDRGMQSLKDSPCCHSHNAASTITHHLLLFSIACCRQYELSECNRGGFCNFMHLKPVTKQLKRDLFEAQRKTLRMTRKSSRGGEEGGGDREERRRSRSGDRGDRSRERRRRDRSRSRG